MWNGFESNSASWRGQSSAFIKRRGITVRIKEKINTSRSDRKICRCISLGCACAHLHVEVRTKRWSCYRYLPLPHSAFDRLPVHQPCYGRVLKINASAHCGKCDG